MASTTAAETPAAETSDAELTIGGMTCASCAARVEKKLNRMDGVTATVNYATEKARVSYGAGITLGDLVATVEKTGYTAQPVARPAPAPSAPAPAPATESPTRTPTPAGAAGGGLPTGTPVTPPGAEPRPSVRAASSEATTPVRPPSAGPTRPSPRSGSASRSRRCSPCRWS